MHTLGCLFAIIFGMFWFIATAIINIYRTAFGSSAPKEKKKKQWSYSAGHQPGQNGAGANSRQRRRKMFEDNEGEYVDFVEVP